MLLPARNYLNPESEIVAFVTEDRGYAIKHGIPPEKVFYYWNLDELIQNIDFDCLVFACVSDAQRIYENVLQIFKEMNVSMDKIFDIRQMFTPDGYILNAMFKRLEKDPQTFKIFATGSSVLMHGLSARYFKLPLINFSGNAQDLYYSFKIAEKVLDTGGGGQLFNMQ
ncbi:MAG: hypothetical protein IJ575_06650 [Selenomonadaceae bacterium]|nr:hypothetical protein [Selenomonadaceae bacterium]